MPENKKHKLPVQINIISVFFIYLIAGIILFYPSLNNKVLLFGTDTVTHDYLMEIYGWNYVLSENSLPLWMPYLFGGLPLISSFAFCPYYPTKIFSLFLKFPFAFNFQYFISAILGGFFFYLFLRAFKLSKSASLFGGISFLFCGHFITLIYPGHLAKFQAITGIPLALAGLRYGLNTKKLIYFLYSGIGISLSITGSHFQIAFYSVILIGAYMLFFLFENRKTISTLLFLKYIIYFIIGLCFGLSLSAIQIIPGMEFSKLSNRADYVDIESAAQGSFPPLETAEYILPRFTGDSISFPNGLGHYWGWWGERLVSDYIGMGIFILAIFAIFLNKSKSKYFFIFTAFISLFLAYGNFTPIWKFAYNYLPFFNRFRSPATIMIITTISIIYLASLGFEEIFRKKDDDIDANPEEKNNEQKIKFINTSDFIYFLLALSLITLAVAFFLNRLNDIPRTFLETKNNLNFSDLYSALCNKQNNVWVNNSFIYQL